MGVDHNIFLGLLLQRNLLVCLTKIQLGEILSSTESGEQILYLRNWIAIQFRDWIDCDTKVTANSNTVFVLFQNSYNRGCPFGYLQWLENTLRLKSFELLVDPLSQSKRDRSRRVKAWYSIRVHTDLVLKPLRVPRPF